MDSCQAGYLDHDHDYESDTEPMTSLVGMLDGAFHHQGVADAYLVDFVSLG
jgi:hypothetical protein